MADETGMDNDLYRLTKPRDPCWRCGLDHPHQEGGVGDPDACIKELGERVRNLEEELYQVGARVSREARHRQEGRR